MKDTMKNNEKRYTDQYFLNESKANKAFRDLAAYYNHRKDQERNGFPDYYGGSYLDQDGSLTVRVKGDELKSREELRSIFGSNDFKTKKAEYSLRELTEMMRRINQSISDHAGGKAITNISCFWIDSVGNRIVVELLDYTEEKMDGLMKRLGRHPAICFREAAGRHKRCAALKPGDGIKEGGGDEGSAGYRAQRGGANGIVTAAHLISSGQKLYDAAGVLIGECTASHYGGSVDGAFCRITNADYIPDNTIAGTQDSLSVLTAQPVVNSNVTLCGAVSGNRDGKILSNDATIEYDDGTSLEHVVLTDYISQEGDSGGIVYYRDPADHILYTVGINMGGDGSESSYCKAGLVNAQLGIVRY